MSRPDWVYGPDGALARREREQQPERQQQATPPWPAGVIARYLTVGGSTVDISFVEGRMVICEADCLGCGGSDWIGVWESPVNNEDGCRAWAQGHASTCRAMPRPDGAS